MLSLVSCQRSRIVLFGAVLALVGCGDQLSWEEQERIRIAAARRPPPKPPNCPYLPELKNITLKNGKIAEVTIYRFRETTFYVPHEFRRREMPDEAPPETVGRYTPDFARIECPGVVHVVNAPFSDAGFGMGIKNDEGKFFPGNIAKDSEVTGLSFRLINADDGRSKNSTNRGVIRVDVRGGIDFFIRVADDTGIRFFWRVQEITIPGFNIFSPYADRQRERFRAKALLETPEWEKTRLSIVRYFNWLTTPPSKRSNDQIFYLGSKR
jgi:hypothetical protein